jgi:TonB-linked SusC/RagA family outer membrane protein
MISMKKLRSIGKLILSAAGCLMVGITVLPAEKNRNLAQIAIQSKGSSDSIAQEIVPLPIANTVNRKYQLTGSAYTISGAELERYPSSDLRNALKGLIPGLHVQEMHGAPGFTPEEEQGRYGIVEKVDITMRGLGVRYLIDDVPVDITEMMLDPQEVESVTVIKDIAQKAMFGPYAANGIVYIKTKRGADRRHKMNVNLESGVNQVGRMPGFVSADEYATLNNLARENSQMAPLYSDADIAAYRTSNPYDLYHPNVDFKSLMFKNSRHYNRASISGYGGNSTVKYFSYLGYTGEGDIYKLGSKADYNRLNIRSNLDVQVNKQMAVSLNVVAGLGLRRSPNYGYATSEGSGNTRLLELDLALPQVNDIPPLAFPIYASNDPELATPWYGVSSLFSSNPIGNLTKNGGYTETNRSAAAKLGITYDLSSFVPGLRSETNLNFDLLNLIRMGTAEQYAAYTVTPFKTSTGADTARIAKFQDAINDPQRRNLHDYFYQRFTVYQKFDYTKVSGVHDVNINATYYMNRVAKDGILEPQRFQSGILTGRYTYNRKYTVTAVLNNTGTYSFSKANRNGFFPSMGLSWVLSEEDFMKGNDAITYLKLRGEAGVLGFESNFAPFHYRDRWTTSTGVAFGPGPTNRWFGNTNESAPYVTTPARIGNPDLTWERRKEVNLGLEGALFAGKLKFEVNYYNNLRSGQIVQLPNSLPYIVGVSNSMPRFNHNKTRYYGVESALQFNHSIGEVFFSLGGNITLPGSKIVKADEPQYRSSYQFRTGKPVDAYWGHEYLGKFATDSEANLVPQLYDQQLQAGDLKYADLNNDGVVDENDRTMIGRTTPRVLYGIHLHVRYKNFDVFALGSGRAAYDIPMTSDYYWNGWGDNNYSNFVRDNLGGDYPRLTYVRVNNNFVPSDYWVMKGGFFKLQNVEVAYRFPQVGANKEGFSNLKVFVRGANLITISKIKDVDPESVNSGLMWYPLNKTFTAGLKISF